MDGLRLHVLLNSISVISGEKAVSNGTPFAVEKIPPRAGLEPETFKPFNHPKRFLIVTIAATDKKAGNGTLTSSPLCPWG